MKQRIISAIIMAIIFIPILIIGGKVFTILMGVLAVLGLHELLKLRETKKEFPILMKLFAYVLVLFFSLNNFTSIEFQYTLDYRVMSFIIFIFLIPIIFIDDNKKYNINDALFLIGSILFIGLSFNLIIIARNYDILYIVYLLLMTILTDTFALFTGTLIGRHKLSPNISPKKTYEGLIGGLIVGVSSASLFFHLFVNNSLSILQVLVITTALTILGQIGDLVFSSIKRYYGVKDFSNIIPGHGGVLDRLDSIIFVILGSILFISIII